VGGLSKRKRGRSHSKKPSSQDQDLNQNQNLVLNQSQDPQNLEVQNQDLQQSLQQDQEQVLEQVLAAKNAVLQRLEERKDELVQLNRIILEFPVTREMLRRIWKAGRVPVNILLNILMLDYKKTKHEAEVIIYNFITAGLLIPRAVDGTQVIRKRRVRGCGDVYCSLDTPAELFNKCCELVDFQEAAVESSPVLEELMELYSVESGP